MRRLLPLPIALVACVLLASPTGATPSKALVRVQLDEFKVVPKPLKVKRGAIRLSVKNTGKIDHELVVLRTRVAPAKLRVTRGKAVEAGRVGRVGPLEPGASKTSRLRLRPGKYVLICNLPGHYQAGQRIGFRVT